MAQITNKILTLSLILVYASAQIQLYTSTENSVEKYQQILIFNYIQSHQQSNWLSQDSKDNKKLEITYFVDQKNVYVKTWFLKDKEATLNQIKSKQLQILNALMKTQFNLKEKKMVINLMFGTTSLKKQNLDLINLKKEQHKLLWFKILYRIHYTVTYTDSDMTSSITVGSELELKWKFNTDDTIEMCVCLNKKAWVGVGFGSGMNGVDMFAINIIDGAAELLDLYSTSEDTPPTDTTQDITLISSSITDTAVKARIKRKLNTGDSKDAVLAKGSSYTWSYASSSSLVMEDHKNNVAEFKITLSESGSQQVSQGNLLQLVFGLIALNLII